MHESDKDTLRFSGAKIEAYFCYSIVLTTFIYPIVVHWGWGSGFLSAWGASTGEIFTKTDSSNGMIDFAGSGIVHMVGGFSGLMGAIVTGPRRGRFVDGKVVDFYSGNKVLQSLGCFILWCVCEGVLPLEWICRPSPAATVSCAKPGFCLREMNLRVIAGDSAGS